MYTSYIGKKFLKLYNDRECANYSSEQFFNSIIYPVFFNWDKHFINVANCSFFQSVSKRQLDDSGLTIHEFKRERFHRNVLNDGASLTTLVGYAAQGIMAGTSGQVTSMNINIGLDEMYSSWAGIGLSISMGGGFSMIIDDSEILLGIYKGWKIYRDFLIQIPNLKGNQIEVWNSYWLCHILSSDFDKQNPLGGFDFPTPVPCKSDKWRKQGLVEFEGVNWIKVMFYIAKKYPNKIFTINVFKFADTNKTVGFINLFLPEIRRLYEMRDIVFLSKNEIFISEEEIENLTPYFSFNRACELGSIGLKALEPNQLREYMPKPFGQGKEFKISTIESIKQYQLFIIWINAMLNKNELLISAKKIAEILVSLERLPLESGRGLTKISQSNKNFLNSKNLKEYIDCLTELLDFGVSGDPIRAAVEEAVKLPYDLFPLYMSLIKFEYSYQKNIVK